MGSATTPCVSLLVSAEARADVRGERLIRAVRHASGSAGGDHHRSQCVCLADSASFAGELRDSALSALLAKSLGAGNERAIERGRIRRLDCACDRYIPDLRFECAGDASMVHKCTRLWNV